MLSPKPSSKSKTILVSLPLPEKPITSLTQITPNLGSPISEDTQIRIAYNDFYFYVSVICFDSSPEKIQVGDYKIDKYCPHQQYDLSHHGKVDLDKCTIQCLGHGWTWNIKTGKGINCGFDLNTEKIIGE